jgi:hypothetical protein
MSVRVAIQVGHQDVATATSPKQQCFSRRQWLPAIATQLGQQVPQRNGKLYEADYQHLVANNNDVELPGVERDQTKLGPTQK